MSFRGKERYSVGHWSLEKEIEVDKVKIEAMYKLFPPTIAKEEVPWTCRIL